jgi:hypothetical protein
MYTLCSPLGCGCSSFVVCHVTRKHASHFEEHKTAFEEGGGRDDAVVDDEKDRESFNKMAEGSNA